MIDETLPQSGKLLDCCILPRHCEERSDEAIQGGLAELDCFASLAMTERVESRAPQPHLGLVIIFTAA
jgi:hypothetical protein